MKVMFVIPAALLLSGCASVREFAHEHPAVTAFGAAIVIGSVAASLDNGGGGRGTDIQVPRQPDCAATPQACR